MYLNRICRRGLQQLINSNIFSNNAYNVKLTPIVFKKAGLRHCHTTDKPEEVVYIGPLSRQIRSVKLFSLLTSVSGLIAQPLIYERANELGTNTPYIIAVCSVVGFFTFVTPILLHLVTRKYVTQITYDVNKNVYTATVYTIMLRKRNISFEPGEPYVPDVLGMFSSMTVKGVPLFVDAKFFEDVNHYKRIMGYDKPLDYKLSTTDKSSNNQR